MKIAVTSQNRREITEHAGRCRNFWVFDVEDGRVAGRNLLELPKEASFHDSSPHAVHPLDGVDVLIAGGMGSGLQARLRARESRPWSLRRKIRIVRCCSGSRTPWRAQSRMRTRTARTTVSTTITREAAVAAAAATARRHTFRRGCRGAAVSRGRRGASGRAVHPCTLGRQLRLHRCGGPDSRAASAGCAGRVHSPARAVACGHRHDRAASVRKVTHEYAR